MYDVCQSVNFWFHAVEEIRAVSIPVDQAMQQRQKAEATPRRWEAG